MRNEADRVKLTELVDDFSVGYRAQHDKKVTEMAVVKKQTQLKKHQNLQSCWQRLRGPKWQSGYKGHGHFWEKHSTDSIWNRSRQ